MFPRRARLPRASFPAVLKTGRRASSANLSIVASKEGKGCAVVVSKKAARLAVTRNKVRRRVFAALRTLSLPPALIVFPKSSASEVSYQGIEAEMKELLSKIRLPS